MQDVSINLITVSVDANATQKLKQKRPSTNLRVAIHDLGRKVNE
jgi:hypothetical protein